MGLSTAAALAARGRKVILIDAAHPIRGSWGVTRASHFRMEDPVLLRMGLESSKYWKQLQEEYQAEASRSPDLEVEDAHFYHCTGAAMGVPKRRLKTLEFVSEGSWEIYLRRSMKFYQRVKRSNVFHS